MNQHQYENLLRDVRRAGVYHQPAHGVTHLRAAAKVLEFAQVRVKLAGVRDKTGLLNALAQALRFPDWFGHNWDALEDCLTDLSWMEAPGYVVTLADCDELNEHAEGDLVAALRIFEAAADYWREEGKPFWTLVDMGADGIAWLPEIA